jgi:hypothetical protein
MIYLQINGFPNTRILNRQWTRYVFSAVLQIRIGLCHVFKHTKHNVYTKCGELSSIVQGGDSIAETGTRVCDHQIPAIASAPPQWNCIHMVA